jgi:hypothetical protein
MAGGKLNGSGREPERDDKIASLEEARRRAKEREKASRKLDRRPGSLRQKLFGAVVILMALAMIVTWLAPLFRSVR